MRALTLEEVNRIGEVVSRELPVTAILEWEYRIEKKSNLLNFKVRDRKDLSKSEKKRLEKEMSEVLFLPKIA